MKSAEALSLLAEFSELLSIGQKLMTLTIHEGRWQALQDWLKDNPKWEKQINKWIQLTPDAAFASLYVYALEQAQAAQIPSFILDGLINRFEQDAKLYIQTIQTCYRERKQENRKEIA